MSAHTIPARARPSWWRMARRVWAASRRFPARPDFASVRPTVVVLHGLAAFAMIVGGHPALAALAIVPALMMADGPFNVLRVLRRLLVAQRAMREGLRRPRAGTICHVCGFPGEGPCDIEPGEDRDVESADARRGRVS